MMGILVEPPTRITSSISLVDKLASFRAFLTGDMERFTRSSANCSKFDRDKVVTKCLGPESVAVT